MVRKQLYIDERQDSLLKAESERTGETESALVRRAIDAAYDAEALRLEGEARAARFNEVFDRAAEEIARSGRRPEWIPRTELYRNGRPR